MQTKERELLKQAAEWRLIGLLFECPKGDWLEQVSSLAKEVQDPKLKLAVQAAEIEANEGLYHSILGPGGPAPAREISYNSWAEPGRMISELTSYYKAFSFQPVIDETVDHIAMEVGFISYLRLKEAYAIACDAMEEAKITAEASEKFITEHLNIIAEPLVNILEDLDVEYLKNAGQALLMRVGQAKHKSLPVFDSSSEIDECQFSCGEA
ncbi:MAG: molecular chaperone TorD family protein [Blastocatellia bacterium]